jgi:hypothetical protein
LQRDKFEQWYHGTLSNCQQHWSLALTKRSIKNW